MNPIPLVRQGCGLKSYEEKKVIRKNTPITVLN